MDTSFEDEPEQSMPKFGIPMAVRDTRQSYEKRRAVYIILASTLFERIAFYTLAANLALNFETKKRGVESSKTNVTLFSFFFSGISYISTIAFAVISDAKLGRAKTIVIGFGLYLVGYGSAIAFTATKQSDCIDNLFGDTKTLPSGSTWCVVWLCATLIVIAIGAGAVEANMAVFGAEQIQEFKVSSRYFDKYMVVVNIGGIIGTLVIRSIYNYYLSGNGTKHNLDEYLIPAIVAGASAFLAALLFMIGWRYYIHITPHDSVITNCIPVIINAFQSRRRYEQQISSQNKQTTSAAPSTLLNASQSLSDDDRSVRIDYRPATFLDFAKVPHGKFHDRIVNDVKSLRGALAVFTLFLPYCLIYSQLSSTFPIQARYMNLSTDSSVTYIWLGDPVTIIIGILLFNVFVYKFIDARHRTSTIVTKFVLGMCFAAWTMCLAGVVEGFRQDKWNQDQNKSSLLLYFQLPQNIFMGISEIFAMIASYEYAYFAAPQSAQTLFMSFRFCSVGISSLIATGYIEAFNINSFQLDFSRRPDPLLRWPFYTYFFILGGIQLIFILIFVACQRKFQIIKLNPQHVETH